MNDKIKRHRESVTATLIEALKNGTAPWQKPWNGEWMPCNALTGRRYNGSNAIILSCLGEQRDGGKDPRWLTFNQAKAKGWNIRKGEHGTAISLWKHLPVEVKGADGEPVVDKDGKPLMKGLLMERLFVVFHASQVEGIPAYAPETIDEVEAIEKAERILSDSGADIRHGGFRAFYQPDDDFIQLPEREFFASTADYYATALHELTHWTGHATRLKRFSLEHYALERPMEELVAEIGSMFVSAETGIPQTEAHFQNHAAYVASWIKELQSDPDALFRAAADANKAAEFILKAERAREADNVEDVEEPAA